MKKTVAFLLTLLLCLCTLTACKGTGKALTVNGEKVDQAEYAFFLNYNRISFLADKSSYTKDELKQARERAIEQIVLNETVRQKCEKYGIKLSKEQKKQLESDKKAFVKALGGNAKYLEYLKAACLTDRGYDKLAENEMYYNMLQEYVQKQSDEEYTDQQLRQFFGENYICVKYVRLSITAENGEPMTEHGLAQVRAQAESILAQSKNTETAFEELILRYSDDVAEEGGTEGIIVSILDAKGQPYIETAFGLETWETALCLQSDGYYIVQKQEVPATYFEENRSYVHQTALDYSFMKQLDEWCVGAKVKIKDAVYKINFKNIEEYIK